MNLFRFVPGYESTIYDNGREPLLCLFLAFLVTFALVRLYTRLARKHGWGSGSAGGVHVHHMVPGVILAAVGGILAVTQYSGNEVVKAVAAILFGVGLALVLDEFAMILHLRDVYWTSEGRTSVDAMLMGLAGSGVLMHASFALGGESAVALSVTLGIAVVLAAVTFLKKKPFLGIVALAVLPVGIVTAIRLGKPGSPWARWFYDPDRGRDRRRSVRERKRDRSARRYTVGWSGRFERWFSDLVGGAPTPPSDPADLPGGPQASPDLTAAGERAYD
jgi:lysyl-tRNA synthetase class 2